MTRVPNIKPPHIKKPPPPPPPPPKRRSAMTPLRLCDIVGCPYNSTGSAVAKGGLVLTLCVQHLQEVDQTNMGRTDFV